MPNEGPSALRLTDFHVVKHLAEGKSGNVYLVM